MTPTNRVIIPKTEFDRMVAEAPPEDRFTELQEKIETVASTQLRQLLDRQNEILDRIEALADLENEDEVKRKQAILDAELKSVREEVGLRTENVGVLAAELFGLYDELGLQAQKAKADSPEDERMRQDAQNKLADARQALAHAQIAETAAEHAIEGIKNGWWPFGKSDRIAVAQTAVTNAQAAINTAEKEVAATHENVKDVEEQIELLKADRVRKASLSENFALIREFTGNAVKVLKEDIDATTERQGITKKALDSALAKKRDTARGLDALRDALATLDRNIERERRALEEIPDQGGAAYAEQQGIVTKLEHERTEKTGDELRLNTLHMSLTAAIAANKSSLAGLTAQRDTAEVFVIKLETAEKTAHIVGQNIDRMVKNVTQESASDALDRVNDRMVTTAIELGIQAEVASGKLRNDAIERHDALMRRLTNARNTGDEAMAIEAERYIALDQKIRKGYADRGIDLDMSHLQAAAEAFAEREARKAPATDDITY